MLCSGIIREEGAVRLAEHVMLREEHFGGIVLNANTGDILEVDREAFNLLSWLRQAGAAGIGELTRYQEIRAMLPALLTMEIAEYLPEEVPAPPGYPLDKALRAEPSGIDRRKHYLSAPETVHLAVTYRCDNACIDCYSRRHKSTTGTELDTTQMCGVINKISDSGVFQLAIGGGEPFVRADLGQIVEHAANKGLLVHVTTGQYSPSPQLGDVLNHIKTLHIGIRSEELLGNPETNDELLILSEYARSFGVMLGANLIMTRYTINNIEKILGLLLRHGFGRVIFLRYKPTLDVGRWNAENPQPDELRAFQRWLTDAKPRYQGLMLRIDCAASFLMRDVIPADAVYSGIKGCTAGDRIISVAPDGSVFPCSQLVGDPFCAGNLAKDSFETIWHESDALNRYRFFRENASLSGGVCGKCRSTLSCGGCRVFAENFVGSEPFCPIGPQL